MDPLDLYKEAAEGQVFDADRFNSDQEAIEDAINKITQSTLTSDSGAEHVKTEEIDGHEGVSNVMAWIKHILTLGVGGLPPDGSITNDKMHSTVKPGLLASLLTQAKASLVAAINEVVGSIATVAGALVSHKSSNDHDGVYYTETEMDILLNTKINKSIATAAGDMLISDGAGSWARFAKGAANQVHKMNSDASGHEWATLVYSASGYAASSVSVPKNNGTATVSIPTGISASHGILTFYNTSDGGYAGCIAIFTTTAAQTQVVRCSTGGSGFMARGNGTLHVVAMASYPVQLNTIVLDGTNLKVTFENGDSSNRTVNYGITWEVFV